MLWLCLDQEFKLIPIDGKFSNMKLPLPRAFTSMLWQLHVAAKFIAIAFMNTELIVEIAGWLGVIFYVCAYLLLSIGMLKANGYYFHFLNVLGATGLIIDAAYHVDMPNLVVNVLWFVIGVFATGRRFIGSLRQQNGGTD
jgi:hypothetical protein